MRKLSKSLTFVPLVVALCFTPSPVKAMCGQLTLWILDASRGANELHRVKKTNRSAPDTGLRSKGGWTKVSGKKLEEEKPRSWPDDVVDLSPELVSQIVVSLDILEFTNIPPDPLSFKTPEEVTAQYRDVLEAHKKDLARSKEPGERHETIEEMNKLNQAHQFLKSLGLAK